eukprot:CFRG0491T1
MASPSPFRLPRRKSSFTDLATDDAGCKLMTMCQAHEDYLDNFDEVVRILKDHLAGIIKNIHRNNKIMVSDGKTSIFVPPPSEEGDNHGGELLRSYSECVDGNDHLILAREFKVHVEKDGIEVRCCIKRNVGGGIYSHDQQMAMITL